jgi:uncharacterized protein YceK
MTTMTHDVRQSTSTGQWLKAASGAVIAFGVVTALAAVPALDAPLRWLIDLAFLPFDGRQTMATSEARLLAAIGGGLTVGLGVLLYMIAAKVYPRDPGVARQIMLAGIWSWFLVDGLGSTLAGAPFNVILNIGFLLAFVWPLRQGVVKAL